MKTPDAEANNAQQPSGLAMAPCSALFVADCVNAKRTAFLCLAGASCAMISLLAGVWGNQAVDVMAIRIAAVFNAGAVVSLFFERLNSPNTKVCHGP